MYIVCCNFFSGKKWKLYKKTGRFIMKNSIKRFGKNYLQSPKFYVKITHGCEISRCVGMADEADSKSVVGNHVRVQVPPPACSFCARIA